VSENLASTHPGNPLAIGIDIGGTTIKAAIVSIGGALTENFREPSPRSASALRDFVHSVLKSAKVPVQGIGIGCKGVIDNESSRVKSLPGDLHFLEGQLLSNVVEAGQLTVCADNDARTALIAEVLWGAARGRRNAVLLTLGTGVGGAALVDGVIVRGCSGAAGHLGHMTVDLRGGLCICGNYGCLETHFSSRAIESDYAAHLYRAGDESARHVLDRAFEYLAAAMVSFMHIFDPEILILGGNIAAAGPQLLTAIQDKVARRTKVLLGREVPIVFQKAIGYGGVAGAAGLVFLKQGLLAI